MDLLWGECILRHADSRSTTLQRPNLSAAEGQSIASMAVNTLSNLRSEKNYLFWADVLSKAEERDTDEPALPRRRGVPGKLDCGTAAPEYFMTPKLLYITIYYEALDLIVSLIKDRFDQRDYNVYMYCEQLLVKAAAGGDAYTDEFQKTVTSFYGSDFYPRELEAYLRTFTHNIPRVENETLSKVLAYLRSLSSHQQQLLPQVIKLANLILVMPATNATSERSFSALRRVVKIYLRTTMTEA